MHAQSLSLAALTAEQQARSVVVGALATAAEILEQEHGHGLCTCQRVTLLAALEGAFGGFAVNVFETALARAQEIEAGSYALRDVAVPGLIEQYLGIDPEGLHLADEDDEPAALEDPFADNGDHSVAADLRLEDVRPGGVADRVNDYLGGGQAA